MWDHLLLINFILYQTIITDSDSCILSWYFEGYEDFETTNGGSHTDEQKSGIVVFDDVLESNQAAIGAFSTRGKHKDLDVDGFFLSTHSSYDLSKRTSTTNNNIVNLF